MRRRRAGIQGLRPKPCGLPKASSDQLKHRKLLRSTVTRSAFASTDRHHVRRHNLFVWSLELFRPSREYFIRYELFWTDLGLGPP